MKRVIFLILLTIIMNIAYSRRADDDDETTSEKLTITTKSSIKSKEKANETIKHEEPLTKESHLISVKSEKKPERKETIKTESAILHKTHSYKPKKNIKEVTEIPERKSAMPYKQKKKEKEIPQTGSNPTNKTPKKIKFTEEDMHNEVQDPQISSTQESKSKKSDTRKNTITKKITILSPKTIDSPRKDPLIHQQPKKTKESKITELSTFPTDRSERDYESLEQGNQLIIYMPLKGNYEVDKEANPSDWRLGPWIYLSKSELSLWEKRKSVVPSWTNSLLPIFEKELCATAKFEEGNEKNLYCVPNEATLRLLKENCEGHNTRSIVDRKNALDYPIHIYNPRKNNQMYQMLWNERQITSCAKIKYEERTLDGSGKQIYEKFNHKIFLHC
jgi:hypothetical protein